MVFASLGVISLRDPFRAGISTSESISTRSLFFGTICLAVFLILAYLTNPSEASFRTFLTEQSFRRHLTKLDESSDKAHDSTTCQQQRYQLPQHDASRSLSELLSRSDGAHQPPASASRFHFARRVGISMQTPAHIYRSFGIFTAAVMPIVDPTASTTYQLPLTPRKRHGRDDDTFRGTWFVGAFGKWWIGGVVDLSKRDVNSLSEPDGQDVILGKCIVRSLDQSDSYDGLRPLGSSTHVNVAPVSSSPTRNFRSRARARSVKQTATPLPSRGSTPPPPLQPHTLPLHAPRLSDAINGQLVSKEFIHGTIAASQTATNVPSYEHVPLIAELQQQISDSQTTTSDLRIQLTTFQSQAFASHAALQTTLDEQRTKKRQEDAARVELKARTKTLEESKRHADTSRREAEKRLRIAQSAKDSSINRAQRLLKDAQSLRQQLEKNIQRAETSRTDMESAEIELLQSLESKRIEIKSAEDAVAAISLRSRDLEEELAGERKKLADLKADIQRRQENAPQLFVQHNGHAEREADHDFRPFVPLSQLSANHQPLLQGEQEQETDGFRNARSQSLNGLAHYDNESTALHDIEDKPVSFSPFDMDSRGYPDGGPILSPMSTSLLPTNLFKSIETDGTLTPAFDGPAPFGYGLDASPGYSSWGSHTSLPIADRFDAQRAQLPAKLSQTLQGGTEEQEETLPPVVDAAPRRWFSKSSKSLPSSATTSVTEGASQMPVSLREKTGLNPEAKVFKFPARGASLLGGSLWSSPTGFPMIPPATSTLVAPAKLSPQSDPSPPSTGKTLRFGGLFSSRPFAPSAAEREALERALGGKNLSGDRLSLGDDGSTESFVNRLPPSPFVLPPDSSVFLEQGDDQQRGWPDAVEVQQFGPVISRQHTR